MFAVVRERLGLARLDDERPVEPACSWKPEWLWYQYVPPCRTVNR